MSSTYKSAGVDIDAATRAMGMIKGLVKSTFTPGVLTDIGTFGGMFALDKSQYEEPVLVASTDSVGTKIRIAVLMNKHDTVGIDIVSHCVNDILVQGARPLFFLDYFGCAKLIPEMLADVVKGLTDGCKQAGCALLGGETAELPGMYSEGDYDLVGSIVGVVDKSHIIDGHTLTPGDALIGLASTGLHTNGFSLARKLLLADAGYSVETILPELGCSVGEALLKPHRCYAPSIFKAIDAGIQIKGMAHITGGGFIDNIPRILPENRQAQIQTGTWPVLPIFDLMQRLGNVVQPEMFRTFNMGIGLVVAVPEEQSEKALSLLNDYGEKAYRIGKIVEGERKTVLI